MRKHSSRDMVEPRRRASNVTCVRISNREKITKNTIQHHHNTTQHNTITIQHNTTPSQLNTTPSQHNTNTTQHQHHTTQHNTTQPNTTPTQHNTTTTQLRSAVQCTKYGTRVRTINPLTYTLFRNGTEGKRMQAQKGRCYQQGMCETVVEGEREGGRKRKRHLERKMAHSGGVCAMRWWREKE